MVACGVAQEDVENGFASIIIVEKGKTRLIEGKSYLVDLHVVKVIDVEAFVGFQEN